MAVFYLLFKNLNKYSHFFSVNGAGIPLVAVLFVPNISCLGMIWKNKV